MLSKQTLKTILAFLIPLSIGITIIYYASQPKYRVSVLPDSLGTSTVSSLFQLPKSDTQATTTEPEATTTTSVPTGPIILLHAGDSLVVTSTTDVDITGWTIRNAAGESYRIPRVSIELNGKGSEPHPIPTEGVKLYKYSYTTVIIEPGGDPSENYVHRTEAETYDLYAGGAISHFVGDQWELVDTGGTIRAQTK